MKLQAAHPRVCGENSHSLRRAARSHGSSPRVRGKHHRRLLARRGRGLIPACAGKTSRGLRAKPARSAHPRVCGENHCFTDTANRLAGSSPRVRGKRSRRKDHRATAGLIPACAGKTHSTRRGHVGLGAHPRVCGENSFHAARARWLGGSSPRVRGKLKRVKIGDVTAGLIPACAGKTTTTRRTCRTAWAHPRVCGENALLKSSAEILPGSSPRVRGKRQPDRCLVVEVRLIPACAGKTRAMVDWEINRRAHPRVCGENGLCRDRRRRDGGSSPRVRGKRSLYACSSVHLRLIPACAGKTESTRRVICNSLAHPRVCGENTPAKSGTPG